MKRLLFLLIAFISSSAVFAEKVTEQEAFLKAQQFLEGKQIIQKKQMQRKFLHCAPRKGVDCNAYYVFNVEDKGGFVIVSGDDRTEEILGYSDTGTFDTSNMPDNVKSWLGYYEQVIRSLGDLQIQTTPRSAQHTDIAPLVKTTWGQGHPYNSMCPQKCVTGCVATAMAQVINYHQWPISTTTKAIPEYSFVDELPVTKFDWENMNNAEVAKLMLYCGASVQMNYGFFASGASSYSPAIALPQYFGYDSGIRFVARSDFGVDEWENMIYEELAARRPVIYCGNSTDEGHAFVCDGYRDGLYHINWGWDGSCNGFFSLSILNPYGSGTGGSSTADGYSISQSAIIGIQKPVGQTSQGKKVLIQMGLSVTEENDFLWNLLNINTESFKGDVGVALFSDSGTSSILKSQSTDIESNGWYLTHINVNDMKDVANGTYTLKPVYRPQGAEDWLLCDGTAREYVEITSNNGSVTYRTHPLVDIKVNSLTFSAGKIPYVMQDVLANVTNNSTDEYNGVVTMYVNNRLVSATGAFVRAGESTDVVFRYSPIKGNLAVRIERGDTREILYEETITIGDGVMEDPFVNLNDHQMIFGHYTTDDYNSAVAPGNWIFNDNGVAITGTALFATAYSEEKMKQVKGNKLTHIRFALSDRYFDESTICNFKVWIGTSLDEHDVLEMDVPSVQRGWNVVKLNTPIILNSSRLYMGIQYDDTELGNGYVIASCHNGDEFCKKGACLVKIKESITWEDVTDLNWGGLLAFQCLLEGDNFHDYDVELCPLRTVISYSKDQPMPNNVSKYIKQGTAVDDALSFKVLNVGRKDSPQCTIEWKIDDGEVIGSLECSAKMKENEQTIYYHLPANLPVGRHVVKVYVSTVNGNTPSNPAGDTLRITYKVWSQDIGRQKTLIELPVNFTDSNVPETMTAIRNVMKDRDDLSLVTSPHTDEATLMGAYEWTTRLQYDRDAHPGAADIRSHCDKLPIEEELRLVVSRPAFATVNISAQANDENALEIHVSGQRNDEYSKLIDNAYLTIGIVEDSVEMRQAIGYDLNNMPLYDHHFKFDGILRQIVTGVWGDYVRWKGNEYEMTYTIIPMAEWNLKNARIVAFLSGKYDYSDASDADVLNCNDFLLRNIDLTGLQTLDDRLKFVATGNGTAKVMMRDTSIGGDIVLPSSVEINGESCSVTDIGFQGFLNSNIRQVQLPNSIETIDTWAFNQSRLESINIPASVQYIANGAFGQCRQLKSITMDGDNPNYKVVDNALIEKRKGNMLIAYPIANGVTDYTIPDGITQINDAFTWCPTLQKVTIPEGVAFVCNSFEYCYNLKEINLPSTIEDFSGLCYTQIEHFEAPAALTYLGNFTFGECHQLKRVSLEKSQLSRLENWTFGGCTALEELLLPATLTWIDADALFKSCNALQKIYVYNPEPAEVTQDFDDVVYSNATLYVPTGSLEKYSSALHWQNFFKIEEFDALIDAIQDVTLKSSTESYVYDLQGRRLSKEPAHGMYIQNGQKRIK